MSDIQPGQHSLVEGCIAVHRRDAYGPEGGPVFTAEFFDGHREVAATYERVHAKAMDYSLHGMNRFGWHVYRNERWRIGREMELNKDTGELVEKPGPWSDREVSDLGSVHDDRDCEIATVWGKRFFDPPNWTYTPDPYSHIVTFHVEDTAETYIDRYLCSPCAHEVFVSLAQVTGPGAWEYR